MQLANDVYIWWYWGLGGLGGWALFLLLAIIAAAYVYFDSASKEINAVGWRLGTLLPMLLFLPTLLFRFANANQPIDPQASEWFLVLGVLGATIAVAAAVGYGVTYWGYKPPAQQPAVRPAPPPPAHPSYPEPRTVERPSSIRPSSPPKPARPKAGAWLMDAEGRQHQLYIGDTRIGRSSRGNDIVLSDPSVSREHALIREKDGTFTIYDRGSKAGVYLNNHRLRQPQMLYHGDIIQLGEVRFTFVSSRG